MAKTQQMEDVRAIYNYGMAMIDEAESNLLDSYEGTSFEVEYRKTYNRKRGYLKKLARNAGLTV